MKPIKPNKEKTLHFIKSSRCAGGDCVEVAILKGGGVIIRDTKDTAQPWLRFSQAEWQTFLQGVKAGEFDTK